MIPILHTERLILRPHQAADFDAYFAMWSDPAVVRFIGGKPFDRETSWTRFLRHAGMWLHMGFGYLAITDRQTGAFLGETGFQELRRKIDPAIEGSLEAGWVLRGAAQGRGIVTEAVSAMMAWADEAHAGRRITCFIEPSNEASRRVAAKLGFAEFARTDYHGAEVILFERNAPSRTQS
ncbi:GNAT family N-acetyltransferase [Rhizobium alvei]|uniref:GNAT family N-acetyltransferase n=1 Tax=Rhizobium alvei TaxID=1132659 RepID=A0ABT8YHX9_9HYPH|nr:GNAT family N-acetyltransferase [Rhizobium alvei]MDO6963236.1 GNAT family N-acetyltransferase [Rhizobium alvei]